MKRLLSLLLCIVMLFGLLPVQDLHVKAASSGYSITYDANPGDGGTVSGSVPEAAGGLQTGDVYQVQEPAEGFERELDGVKYYFEGWNTAPDGSGVNYAPGEELIVPEADLILYARWYRVTKYVITVKLRLDDELTDMANIHSTVQDIYVSTDQVLTETSKLLKLTKTATGTYQTTVDQNGTYYVFMKHKGDDGVYEQAHGHQVIILNQSEDTELLNYTITYSTGDKETTWKSIYHANETVLVDTEIPEKEGYVFDGWKTKDDQVLWAKDVITTKLLEPVELVAQWKKTDKITVNLTLNHKSSTGFVDSDEEKGNVEFQLLNYEDGVNTPVGEKVSLTGGTFDAEKNQTTYTYVFDKMPPAHYHISTAKSKYKVEVEEAAEGTILNVVYTYEPNDFDLNFEIQMAEGTSPKLYPQAVNVRVSVWEDGIWEQIPYHTGNGKAPVTVFIDQETGKGSGFYPVRKYIQDNTAYVYRLDITSYVLPDGTTVAASSEDKTSYVIKGSDLYAGTLNVDGGKIPDYTVDNNTTALNGAYFDGEKQNGALIFTISANSHTVTFDPGETASVLGQDQVTLTEQYKYPNLNEYAAVSANPNVIFEGWEINEGTLAENQAGEYLQTDVIYKASWKEPLTVTGTVEIDATYQQGDAQIFINEIDRAKNAVVVLEKKTNDVYNAVASAEITFDYSEDEEHASAVYEFRVPEDGSEYRIRILVLNYETLYDNNKDGFFYAEESVINADAENKAKVDAHMFFAPDSYLQEASIDASRINAPYRPMSVLAEYQYRDIDRTTDYQKITQHTEAPYGLQVSLDEDGKGTEDYFIWNWHTDGKRYEYRMVLTKFFGAVGDVFTKEGMPYNAETSPYTIRYGSTSWFDPGTNGQRNDLEAVLIPKTYEIKFDMNLGDDTKAKIYGMQDYITDGNAGAAYFSYEHTWSYGDTLTAFPYREGYEFAGWTCETDDVVIDQGGYIEVNPLLAQDVTLKAHWQQVDNISYTVHFLEVDTEKVLSQTDIVTDITENTEIQIQNIYREIPGYQPCKIEVTQNSETSTGDWEGGMSITVGKNTNVTIVIYYEEEDSGSADDNVFLSKTATLEDDGTYTISMETYTTDSAVKMQTMNNTPLDIVLVLDQSGSIINSGYLDELQDSVDNFITEIAEHGRKNEVDHRIAMVGYAGDYDEPPTGTDTSKHPIAGGNTTNWVNTGVFDSNGDFHPYDVTGFNYTEFTGTVSATGTYYTYVGDGDNGEYLLMMHHDTYYHLIAESEAREELLKGTTIYGYIDGGFKALTRNLSGLWLYTDTEGEKLYSMKEFFTFHEDVWTHRQGLEKRQIHGYGTGANYRAADGHEGLYVRNETKDSDPDLNVYKDALVPVSVGQYGSGAVNPGLIKSANGLGSNGGTFVQYGIEMANKIFDANPIEASEGRVRVMLMFTDGMPGIGTFDENEANAAIAKAYVTKNTHNAHCYTIGLYKESSNASNSDVSIYMNAVSSNYPKAEKMDDAYISDSTYFLAQQGTNLNDGNTYYVKSGSSYYPLVFGQYRTGWSGWTPVYATGWYYAPSSWTVTGLTSDEEQNVYVGQDGSVAGKQIYVKGKTGYVDTPYSGYYSTTESVDDLKDYFSLITQEITSKITTQIVLQEDTILRDIMGQGMELTAGTVITAYKQAGTYNAEKQDIDWAVNADGSAKLEQIATLTLSADMWSENAGSVAESEEKVEITLENGIGKKTVSYIQVYNLKQSNTTDPQGSDYHPHTIDVTGYHFEEDYINASHPNGNKLVVKVTRVEARNNVRWDRSMMTNHEQSGMWLPADKSGNRRLLLSFDQPNTIFVERAYVLDYAKPFELDGWYFDQNKGGSEAAAVHLDTVIDSEQKNQDGMNWFDSENPTVSSGLDTKYGKVSIANNKVTYTPTTMQWDGDDTFYVFGKTGSAIVTSQDANENGNLWTRVRVIPANNVYYEDSFVTVGSSETEKGTDGFVFTGDWKIVYSNNDSGNAGKNTETSEHLEQKPNGSVHGWVDSLADDSKYSDGSAHGTGLSVPGSDEDPSMGARAEFVFTGTGVDVYTRTNSATGVVMAMLSKREEKIDDNGNITEEWISVKKIMMDNLAYSGDYYQIPTISFKVDNKGKDLEYGTYKVVLIAAKSTSASTGSQRFEYYLDGIRVYHPLGSDQTEAAPEIQDAYGKEQNAIFTEVRDILLEYKDFNTDMTDSTDGKRGAVFIDWIRNGNEGDNDEVVDESEVGTAMPTYKIGVFENYGPKNEVYLSDGQAIVLKVDPSHMYSVGLKSLTGAEVTANISGKATNGAKSITLSHSTDMYYEVTPDEDGYIVIENASNTQESILSITKLKTTDFDGKQVNAGIVSIESEAAVEAMESFKIRMNQSQVVMPEEKVSVKEIFTDVDDAWYTEAVQYVYDHKLMNGIGGTQVFGTMRNVTKAQLVQVLYSMEGNPTIVDRTACEKLTDVQDGWYTDAVCWAYAQGIVSGNTTTKKFSPNASITREQFASIMYRYAQSEGYQSDQTSDLAGLKNAENVSDWAVEAVKWAVGSGMIQGSQLPDGTYDLAPKKSVTRAQMAAILRNFCEANNVI